MIDDKQTPHYLSRFFVLVAEAERCVNAVDNFDLRSEDAGSLSQWADLCADQEEAALTLIDFCAAHTDDLYVAIQGLRAAD